MLVLNHTTLSLVSAVLYAVAACLAESLPDILALLAGILQMSVQFRNLNSSPSAYFNLSNKNTSQFIPKY
jgi:hypothetical protein